MRHRARRAHSGAAAAAGAKVRLDFYVVAVGRDGAGGADIEAFVAARLRRAAVRADALVVDEELGLLELAHHCRELARRQRLIERIIAGREIPLRQVMYPDERNLAQV